jgi:hypothetical protein
MITPSTITACRAVGRDAQLLYIARDKAKGVSHHAKAGNINSCLLKEGAGHGQFMVVLDCDMVVHPDFLLRTLGHFFAPAAPGTAGAALSPAAYDEMDAAQQEQEAAEQHVDAPAADGSTANFTALVPGNWIGGWEMGNRVAPVDSSSSSCVALQPCASAPWATRPEPGSGDSYMERHSAWVLKPKTAFLQTPQDFWNVDASDPMVHCARFFYGPMLQGRDGIGACPCCGTGVIFRWGPGPGCTLLYSLGADVAVATWLLQRGCCSGAGLSSYMSQCDEHLLPRQLC